MPKRSSPPQPEPQPPQPPLADKETMEGTGLTFQRAKTMPTIPHQYVVRKPWNEEQYVKLFHTIESQGTWEMWNGSKYRYWYPGDGWKYWKMWGTLDRSKIINRARA